MSEQLLRIAETAYTTLKGADGLLETQRIRDFYNMRDVQVAGTKGLGQLLKTTTNLPTIINKLQFMNYLQCLALGFNNEKQFIHFLEINFELPPLIDPNATRNHAHSKSSSIFKPTEIIPAESSRSTIMHNAQPQAQNLFGTNDVQTILAAFLATLRAAAQRDPQRQVLVYLIKTMRKLAVDGQNISLDNFLVALKQRYRWNTDAEIVGSLGVNNLQRLVQAFDTQASGLMSINDFNNQLRVSTSPSGKSL